MDNKGFENLTAPLAEKVRPQNLAEFVGQEHLVGANGPIRKMIERDKISSMIFWGPPGCGKTTLARIIANQTKSEFVEFSAVSSGINEVRKVIVEAGKRLSANGKRTIVFIDEIHRFNKAQQDAFLPHVERGTIILIGATTENPSFEIISPLLSRTRVFVLNALSNKDIEKILKGADRSYVLKNIRMKIEPEAMGFLVESSGGDARKAINALELAVELVGGKGGKSDIVIGLESAEEAVQHKALKYDKLGEEHYDVISAFIKSLRGSDPDAALHYLARMIESGEDPMFIARRMVILASEDVGNADPFAQVLATSTMQAVHLVGMPEARIILGHCATYLACAPKSNASYMGIEKAIADVQNMNFDPVPLHLRNAVTKLMENLGYHKGYKYAHNFEGGVVDQQYLPDNLVGKKYYEPKEIGHEIKIVERIKGKKRKNDVK